MKKEKNDTIYIGILYRFGYELTAAGRSEGDVKKTIMREYVRAYENYNGDDPRKELYDEFGYDEKTTMYDMALEEIEITELEVGKVEWR